jgi:parvulin-like peptidyl-prolyl isomerase
MIVDLLLAAALAAAAPQTPAVTAKAFLKAAATATPACKATSAGADLVEVLLFSPEGAECPVAKIGEDTVLLRELASTLETRHLSRPPGAGTPAKAAAMDVKPEVDRLITARLFVQEAKEIQLDQQPEIRDDLERMRAATLRDMVQRIPARKAKADPKLVEKQYREAVREWKLASVLVDKEDAAKALAAALKGGADFQGLAKKLKDEKTGRGDATSQWVPRKKMLPEILAAVQDAKKGAIVGPLQVGSGWVVLRVDGIRYPEDKEARAAARDQALLVAQRAAIRDFYLELRKRHAVVDEALLKSLDFEAGGEPGFVALAKDERPLVKIEGEKPITVGDLTNEVGKKFFHGIAGPIEQKKVNTQKDLAFEKLIGTRLLDREAKARKLADTSDYRVEVGAYERALLFGTFVEKVIRPDVKVAEAEATTFYDKNKAKFTSPEMLKLDGFAFEKAADAEAALAKLKDGTDFAWLRNTAPGQVPVEKRSLVFDGHTVSAGALGPDLAKSLAGVRAGDYRLYGAGDAEYYVVKVLEQTPPATQPYAEVREAIGKKVFGEKMDKAIADYAAKLRKAQRVEVLLVRVTP